MGCNRYTRNPIYLGFVTLSLGVALLLRSPGALILWPAAIVLQSTSSSSAAIERYLTRRFGEQYLNYKSRVRRWL